MIMTGGIRLNYDLKKKKNQPILILKAEWDVVMTNFLLFFMLTFCRFMLGEDIFLTLIILNHKPLTPWLVALKM